MKLSQHVRVTFALAFLVVASALSAQSGEAVSPARLDDIQAFARERPEIRRAEASNPLEQGMRYRFLLGRAGRIVFRKGEDPQWRDFPIAGMKYETSRAGEPIADIGRVEQIAADGNRIIALVKEPAGYSLYFAVFEPDEWKREDGSINDDDHDGLPDGGSFAIDDPEPLKPLFATDYGRIMKHDLYLALRNNMENPPKHPGEGWGFTKTWILGKLNAMKILTDSGTDAVHALKTVFPSPAWGLEGLFELAAYGFGDRVRQVIEDSNSLYDLLIAIDGIREEPAFIIVAELGLAKLPYWVTADKTYFWYKVSPDPTIIGRFTEGCFLGFPRRVNRVMPILDIGVANVNNVQGRGDDVGHGFSQKVGGDYYRPLPSDSGDTIEREIAWLRDDVKGNRHYGVFIDGLCNFYILVGNATSPPNRTLRASSFDWSDRSVGVYYIDEQTSSSGEWKGIDPGCQAMFSAQQDCYSRTPGRDHERFLPQTRSNWWDFADGRHLARTSMAVSTMNVAVATDDEVFTIHWSFGSMDYCWRARNKPAAARGNADVILRSDMRIYLPGTKDGVAGYYYQSLLPGDSYQAVPAPDGREEHYSHEAEWAFMSEEEFDASS